jgi:hypothetical protein
MMKERVGEWVKKERVGEWVKKERVAGPLSHKHYTTKMREPVKVKWKNPEKLIAQLAFRALQETWNSQINRVKS